MTGLPRCVVALLGALTFAVAAAEPPLRVGAGLPPVARLVAEVGGTAVAPVTSLLPEGRSPHDYAPGPREVRAAARCRIFFSTGMTHETRLTKALGNQVKVVDVTRNIRRIPLGAESCGHDHDHDHKHGADNFDPHVWLSPANAVIIIGNISEALTAADPARAELYKTNAAAAAKRISARHTLLKRQLAPYRGREFFVYHPAFGYFAHEYGLRQSAIELGGREATPARLAEVIRRARNAKVKVVFVQKQFNPASAKALAAAIDGAVVELDPLSADVEKNFQILGDALSAGFRK